MSDDPYYGIREPYAHTGHRGPAIGETVWLLEDAGTLWGVWPTRHDALAATVELEHTNCYKKEWFNLVPVPAGAVRLHDIRKRENIEALS